MKIRTKNETYLEHLFDTNWLLGRILVDVSTENDVGISVWLSVLARSIVSQLLKQLLGHKCVQVVYENLL